MTWNIVQFLIDVSHYIIFIHFTLIDRVRNSGCPVVQDNQKSSRTTKYESLEHFGCQYGQPRLSQKQFCH